MNALKLLWLFGFSLAVTKPKHWHVSEGAFARAIEWRVPRYL
jgi:hypothetical protein